MSYRLVAIDLDGTALDPSGAIRPSVQRSIERVRARGVRVVIATGRRFRTGGPFAEQLGLTGASVFHHGALVKDVETGATRVRRELPGDLYRAAVAAVSRLGPPLVYIDGFPGGEDILTAEHARVHPSHQRYLEDNRDAHRVVPDLNAHPDGALVVAFLEERANLARLRAELLSRLGNRVEIGIHPTYIGGFLLELLPAGVTKWAALRALAEEEGIAPREILAIGDEMNDVDMLRHAGLGVAMGNAPDAVKRAADRVTATNSEDGVAVALERFVLHP